MNPTKAQKQIITDSTQNQLIISGPGTGKTSIISEKVLHLLKSGYKSNEILITTFTNKAIEQLRYRINKLALQNTNISTYNLRINTIHSLCNNLINKYKWQIEEKFNLNLINEIQLKILIFKEYKKLGIEIEKDFASQSAFEKQIFHLLGLFDIFNEQLIPKESLIKKVLNSKENYKINQSYPKGIHINDQKIILLFNKYRNFMWEKGLINYSQLLKLFHFLLKTNLKFKESISKDFKYLIIDEYQDTSLLQNEIFKLILNKKNKILAVGDDDQNIYNFRGTNSQNIENFTEDFPNSKIIKIEENFRSSKTIVKFTKSIIESNKQRFNKNLNSKNKAGHPIYLINENSNKENAELIIKIIQELKNSKEINSYSEIAILFQSIKWQFINKGYKELFDKSKLPYNLSKSGNFLENQTVKTIITGFKLLNKSLIPKDELIKMLKNLNLKENDLSNLKNNLKTKISITEIKEDKIKNNLKIKDKTIKAKLNKLYKISKEINKNQDYNLLSLTYKLFEILNPLNKVNQKENNKNIIQLGYLTQIIEYFQENNYKLKEFLKVLETFNQKQTFSQLESNPNPEAISISTIHSAKGLEYKTVFICDFYPEEYQKPSFNIDFLLNNKPNHCPQEEKYRLLYVGLTRAEKYLFLSYNKNHSKYENSQKQLPSYIKNNLSNKSYKIKKINSKNLNILANNTKLKNKESQIGKKIKNGIKKIKANKFIKLSYSKLKTYEQCPQKYKLESEYEFKKIDEQSTIFGKLIHLILEQIHYKQKEKQKKLSNQEIEQLLQTQSQKLKQNKNIDYLPKAIKIIKSYQKQCLLKNHKILDAEENFEIFFNEYSLKGSIDLITKSKNNIYIHDFKTGKEDPKTKDQILSYILAYKYKHNKKVKEAIVYYLKEKKTVIYKATKKDINYIEEKIKIISKKIINKNFKANPSEITCKKCYFKLCCPDSSYIKD